MAQIYRLRRRAGYRQGRLHFTKTKPTPVGERRRPNPDGQPAPNASSGSTAAMRPPWEVFQRLPDADRYLKPGESLQAIGRFAQAESDTEAARSMQQAKRQLFAGFQSEKRSG